MLESIHDGKLNRKRSRLETIYKILLLSQQGIRKTHIMYQANLSHQQLVKYLEVLLTKQLLSVKNGLYFTTDQGAAFIQKFNEIQSIMGEHRQHLSSSSSL
jgi:predicted transcriptional regulator